MEGNKSEAGVVATAVTLVDDNDKAAIVNDFVENFASLKLDEEQQQQPQSLRDHLLAETAAALVTPEGTAGATANSNGETDDFLLDLDPLDIGGTDDAFTKEDSIAAQDGSRDKSGFSTQDDGDYEPIGPFPISNSTAKDQEFPEIDTGENGNDNSLLAPLEVFDFTDFHYRDGATTLPPPPTECHDDQKNNNLTPIAVTVDESEAAEDSNRNPAAIVSEDKGGDALELLEHLGNLKLDYPHHQYESQEEQPLRRTPLVPADVYSLESSSGPIPSALLHEIGAIHENNPLTDIADDYDDDRGENDSNNSVALAEELDRITMDNLSNDYDQLIYASDKNFDNLMQFPLMPVSAATPAAETHDVDGKDSNQAIVNSDFVFDQNASAPSASSTSSATAVREPPTSGSGNEGGALGIPVYFSDLEVQGQNRISKKVKK